MVIHLSLTFYRGMLLVKSIFWHFPLAYTLIQVILHQIKVKVSTSWLKANWKHKAADA